MRVRLQNFGCYEDNSFTFPDSGLVLLDDKSGAGKSTILKGIIYCLFGERRERVCRMDGLKMKRNCAVTLEYKDHVFYRKNPKTFHITKGVGEDREKLEGSMAQTYLCGSFLKMNYAEFVCSSYSAQNERNSILSLTSQEQLKFIENFAFQDNAHNVNREKITDLIKSNQQKKERFEKEVLKLISSAHSVSQLQSSKNSSIRLLNGDSILGADCILDDSSKSFDACFLRKHIEGYVPLSEILVDDDSLGLSETIYDAENECLIYRKKEENVDKYFDTDELDVVSVIQQKKGRRLTSRQKYRSKTPTAPHPIAFDSGSDAVTCSDDIDDILSGDNEEEGTGILLKDAPSLLQKIIDHFSQQRSKCSETERTLLMELEDLRKENERIQRYRTEIASLETKREMLLERYDIAKKENETDKSSLCSNISETIERMNEEISTMKVNISDQKLLLKIRDLVEDRDSRLAEIATKYEGDVSKLRENPNFVADEEELGTLIAMKKIQEEKYNEHVDQKRKKQSAEERIRSALVSLGERLENEGFYNNEEITPPFVVLATKAMKKILVNIEKEIAKNQKRKDSLKSTLQLILLSKNAFECPCCHNKLKFNDNHTKLEECKDALTDLSNLTKKEKETRSELTEVNSLISESEGIAKLIDETCSIIEAEKINLSIAVTLFDAESSKILKKKLETTQEVTMMIKMLTGNMKRDVESLTNSKNKSIDKHRSQLSDKNPVIGSVSIEEMESECLNKMKECEKLLDMDRRYKSSMRRVLEMEAEITLMEGNIKDIHRKCCVAIDAKSIDKQLVDTREKFASFTEKVNIYKKKVEELDMLIHIQEKKDGAIEIAKKLFDVDSRIQTLARLLECCKTAEILSVENTINDINERSSHYLSEFFETDEILIELKNEKEATGKKEVKNKMCTYIQYKNNTFYDISVLSGGEKQRADLSFLIALNERMNSPFLFLDECLSNLDPDINSSVIKHLSEFNTDKLIIVISHDAVKGYFSDIVNVKKRK